MKARTVERGVWTTLNTGFCAGKENHNEIWVWDSHTSGAGSTNPWDSKSPDPLSSRWPTSLWAASPSQAQAEKWPEYLGYDEQHSFLSENSSFQPGEKVWLSKETKGNINNNY